MESYVVSARKYRPSTFKMVVGQDNIVRTLKNAIVNNHLAQAFLFTGPRGVGKTTCARIMAKTINCTNITSDGEACNECASCQSFNSSASFNIHELDAASNNSVEDIRNLVEQVRVPPQEGKFKIYIIDEVHMLSQAAFNAFLKTLEEPPAYAKFILATTERHKIIPTILSRCQIYNFKRIGVDDIAKHLEYVAQGENISAESDALHIIAQKADGALRDALSLFDQMVTFSGSEMTYHSVIENLNILDYDNYFQFTTHFLTGNFRENLVLLNAVTSSGFDGQHIISGLSNHIRSLLVARDETTAPLLEMGAQMSKRYHEQAINCPEYFLAEALDMLTKAEPDYRQSNVKGLMLENLIIQLSLIISRNETEAGLKKKIAEEQHLQASEPDSLPYQSATSKEHLSTEKIPDPGKIRSVSITQKMSELGKKEQAAVKEEHFDLQMLRSAVNKYSESIRSTKLTLFSILADAEIIKSNETCVEVRVDGPLKVAEIDAMKGEILAFLRKELRNSNILLETILTERKDAQKQTAKNDDQLQQLFEVYPNVSIMVEMLNLVPE